MTLTNQMDKSEVAARQAELAERISTSKQNRARLASASESARDEVAVKLDSATVASIASAQAVSDDLAEKIQLTKAAIADVDKRRAELALVALGDGDTDAKEKLARVHKERAARVLELEDFEHALAASKRRAVEVRVAGDAEVERRRAEQAAPILERLANRGKAIDEALAAYCEEYNAIWRDVDELVALNCPVTSRALIGAHLRRSHDAALSPLKGSAVRLVPPSQRFAFEKLTQGWVGAGLKWVAARLNTN
jgi:hypothetical protein